MHGQQPVIALDGQLPLALRNLPHQLLTDPDAVAAAMAPTTAMLRDFHLLTSPNQFHWWIAHLPLKQAPLMSSAGSDVTFLVEESPAAHLAVCTAGRRRVVTPAGMVQSDGGGALLLPPGMRRAFGSHSAAIFTLQPAAIAAAARAMAGRDSSFAFERFAPREIEPGPVGATLHQLVTWIDQCLGCDLSLPDRLGADDIVLRQVAAMLDPSLLEERLGDGERLRERQGLSAFDELIDYIRANLDKPLRLSDLEALSHYSRRALQYAFQQKLGTTPMGWIRAQRLELAMQRLREGGPHVTVKAVALGCGYRDPRHFSADFQRRFGLAPSAVRRPPL